MCIAYHLMARKNSFLWFLLLSLICTLVCTHSTAAASEDDGRKAIYTHLSFVLLINWICTKNIVDAGVYCVNGCQACRISRYLPFTLTCCSKSLAGQTGRVVSIFPNEKKQLHTTRSWDFVGFPQQVIRTSVENDIIIGVLDSVIWPQSDSFDDEGFGPPPSKWTGTCQGFSNFTCNNKIIGAKYYRSNGQFSKEDLQSPRDSDGHGTHTASTAAGGLVNMATFDDAVADGVDIISISVGSLSVAASTIDRDFFTKVQLGDNNVFEGVSINTFELNDMYPSILWWRFPEYCRRFCEINSMNPNLVKGKIVLCIGLDRAGPKDALSAFLAGAVGTVIADGLPKDFSLIFPLPTSRLTAGDGNRTAKLLHQLNKIADGCLKRPLYIAGMSGEELAISISEHVLTCCQSDRHGRDTWATYNEKEATVAVYRTHDKTFMQVMSHDALKIRRESSQKSGEAPLQKLCCPPEKSGRRTFATFRRYMKLRCNAHHLPNNTKNIRRCLPGFLWSFSWLQLHCICFKIGILPGLDNAGTEEMIFGNEIATVEPRTADSAVEQSSIVSQQCVSPQENFKE
ncbi:Cucumisin [Vitis vinifera]|uniref:Cucumisin n=1 Tax=Vitis vinifera TaxID=29760 RepID=A0A438JY12_VITVI|nr:Cucumisin [Vitis vinifera]